MNAVTGVPHAEGNEEHAEVPKPVRLLLIGMMGCGKTTVGRELAREIGWSYVDNDALVAELSGQATAQVAAGQGAELLHVIEGVVTDRILAMAPPFVAGIPGSTVADAQRRIVLRDVGHVVWLRARLETLAARIGTGAGRPFFAAGIDVQETLERLYEGRAPLYVAAAHQVVDVDDLTPEQIARRIIDQLSTS